jgi:hypothetical protein
LILDILTGARAVSYLIDIVLLGGAALLLYLLVHINSIVRLNATGIFFYNKLVITRDQLEGFRIGPPSEIPTVVRAIATTAGAATGQATGLGGGRGALKKMAESEYLWLKPKDVQAWRQTMAHVPETIKQMDASMSGGYPISTSLDLLDINATDLAVALQKFGARDINGK